jgi:hypothetical protein
MAPSERRNPGTAGNFDHLRIPGSRAILPARIPDELNEHRNQEQEDHA